VGQHGLGDVTPTHRTLAFKGIKNGVWGNMVWEVLIACLLSNGIKNVTVKEEGKQYNQV